MKVTTSTVTKINIRDVADLDPISVYLEDYGPGAGEIIINCFDECWSHYWGSMGTGYDVRKFFCKCDEHYLAGKLSQGLSSTVTDYAGIEAHAKKHIKKLRRDHELTAIEYMNLHHRITDEEWCEELDRDLMYQIYGEEWWHNLPTEPNHKYVYLCLIINTVKEALQTAT